MIYKFYKVIKVLSTWNNLQKHIIEICYICVAIILQYSFQNRKRQRKCFHRNRLNIYKLVCSCAKICYQPAQKNRPLL